MSKAEIPPGYYDGAKGKIGADLKNALHIIIDGHTPLKYTNSKNKNWFDFKDMDVWEALIYTDEACPVTPNCGNVQLLYLDQVRSYTQANRGKGGGLSWDREHVWPKSRGFKKQNQDGYTDLHHLRPADRNINSAHSNYGYDMGGSIIFDKNEQGQKIPTNMKRDKVNKSFEPSDIAKGQVARMIFYMATRYEAGDNQGDEKMPDLYVQDKNDRVKKPWIGDLCTLVDWNEKFGVSDFEKRRNDRVMQVQGNRNPFIDNPKWVAKIWGDKCSA